MALGHVQGALSPDSVLSDEYDVSALEDVDHGGLHGGVAGGGEGEGEGVLRLERVLDASLHLVHDLERKIGLSQL